MSDQQPISHDQEINFGKVSVAEPTKYLEPGEYLMKITEVKLGTPKAGGAPFVTVTAERKEGINTDGKVNKQKMTDKFFLSPNSLPRLKYLYVAYMNKDQFDDVLTSHQQLADYLNRTFTAKEVYKPFVVSGEIADDGTVYSKFGWSGFILDLKDFKGDKVYDPTSAEYKAVVKRPKLDKSVNGNNKTAINNKVGTQQGTRNIWDEEPPAQES